MQTLRLNPTQRMSVSLELKTPDNPGLIPEQSDRINANRQQAYRLHFKCSVGEDEEHRQALKAA